MVACKPQVGLCIIRPILSWEPLLVHPWPWPPFGPILLSGCQLLANLWLIASIPYLTIHKVQDGSTIENIAKMPV
jgi:hypothetical protein